MEANNSNKSDKGGGAEKFVLGAAIGAVAGAIAGKVMHDKYVENKDDIDAKVEAAKHKAVETKDKVVNKAGELKDKAKDKAGDVKDKAAEVGRKAKGKAQRGALRATRDIRKGLDKVDKALKGSE